VRLSVIVPAYNEVATLGEVLARLKRLSPSPEIIVVDDGSTDGTADVIASLNGSGLIVVTLPRNSGKGAAVRAGLARASGDIVAVQDADLELEPEVLPALVAPIAAGKADAVFGTRFALPGNGSPLCRAANALLTSAVNLLFGTRLTDISCGQKAVAAGVVRGLELRSEGFEIETELSARLIAAGARIEERPVPYSPRSKTDGKKVRYLRDGVRVAVALARLRLGPRPAVRVGEERTLS